MLSYMGGRGERNLRGGEGGEGEMMMMIAIYLAIYHIWYDVLLLFLDVKVKVKVSNVAKWVISPCLYAI